MWEENQSKTNPKKSCNLKNIDLDDQTCDVHIIRHMCIFVQNVNFLCVTRCLEGLCTDDGNANANDTNDDDKAYFYMFSGIYARKAKYGA